MVAGHSALVHFAQQRSLGPVILFGRGTVPTFVTYTHTCGGVRTDLVFRVAVIEDQVEVSWQYAPGRQGSRGVEVFDDPNEALEFMGVVYVAEG